jgi:hypothetical protein
MVTWTLTFLPIQQVLLNDGKIEFGKLAEKCMSQDPRRFRDIKTLENALKVYTDCLKYNEQTGVVEFDRYAKRYAKTCLIERSIQFALHTSVSDMEKWQLYPMIIRSNSKKCYLGIPWEEIPKDPDFCEDAPYDFHCDFREEGRNTCKTGCRVSEDTLRKYGVA